MPFDKSTYDKEYAKEHIKRKHIPFNTSIPDDSEMLEWLSSKGNISQYVKELIREDMKKHEALENMRKEARKCEEEIKDLQIPLVHGYRDDEAIHVCLKEDHRIYVGRYKSFEYRIDVDAKKVMTVIDFLKVSDSLSKR